SPVAGRWSGAVGGGQPVPADEPPEHLVRLDGLGGAAAAAVGVGSGPGVAAAVDRDVSHLGAAVAAGPPVGGDVGLDAGGVRARAAAVLLGAAGSTAGDGRQAALGV